MNLEQRAKKLIKDLKITKDYILERSAKPEGSLPYGELLELLRDNGIPKTSGAEIADKIMEILDIKNEKPVKTSITLVVADATLGNDSALANALFDLLKNTRELEYMAHQFHWNIVGVKFNTMHEFYEEEYKQLFEDQDEIAEQIRQQGFFVPVINNVLLEENYSASGFEEQLVAYSDKLTQNIALIDKANDLAKNEIAVQDLCARLKGLRSLSLNLKVKAMLGANKMSLEPSEATAAVDLSISKDTEKELEKLGFKVLPNEQVEDDDEASVAIRKNEDDSFDVIEYENGYIHLRNAPGKRALMNGKYKKDFKFNDVKSLINYLKKSKATASAVTAAKELFKKGDIVNISGDISSNGYNVRVSSTGVVEENQKTYNSKVLVNIDEIDGDKKVSMFVNPKIITLASAVTAGRIAKFALTKEQIGDLKSLGFKLDKGNYLYPSVSKKENGMTVTVTYTPSLAPYKFRVSKFDSEGKLRYESARKNLDDLIEEMKDRLHKQGVTASAVTAGFDKGRYKEIAKESEFFKILKDDCDIRAKNFYAINRGLRLAIRIIKGTFEEASVRYFILKKKGGYVRVELKDKVYIVGYTIYDSGKIKVWTRELKSNVPVNSFDYDMLNMYAKPFGTKMITGMLPTWMSI